MSDESITRGEKTIIMQVMAYALLFVGVFLLPLLFPFFFVVYYWGDSFKYNYAGFALLFLIFFLEYILIIKKKIKKC